MTGSSRTKETEEEELNTLIERINDLFGKNLSEEDRLAVYDQPMQSHMNNEELKDIAKVNSYAEFENQFKNSFFLKTMIEKKSVNEELYRQVFTDKDFKSYLIETMSKELYNHFN